MPPTTATAGVSFIVIWRVFVTWDLCGISSKISGTSLIHIKDLFSFLPPGYKVPAKGAAVEWWWWSRESGDSPGSPDDAATAAATAAASDPNGFMCGGVTGCAALKSMPGPVLTKALNHVAPFALCISLFGLTAQLPIYIE